MKRRIVLCIALTGLAVITAATTFVGCCSRDEGQLEKFRAAKQRQSGSVPRAVCAPSSRPGGEDAGGSGKPDACDIAEPKGLLYAGTQDDSRFSSAVNALMNSEDAQTDGKPDGGLWCQDVDPEFHKQLEPRRAGGTYCWWTPSHEPAIPGSLPSPSEELWIIQKPEEPAQPTDADRPGCGALMAVVPGEEKQIPLPLKHTDVSAGISAYIATVDVTQQYHNPYDSKIEAVYVFPLPENAAVNEFIMTVGERRIRGIIREREEAERTYAEAKAQGYVASLLTQERPNVFTQKVANIEPGKTIDINIKYFHTLAYVDGWYEYVFPMVVGPRFNPPGTTDGVGSVGRGANGKSGQKTEVQYLKPGERSGHDISLAVKIDAGVAIEEVKSTNHVIAVKKDSPEQAAVKLSDLDAIPNKDFVLRYKVAGQRIKSALLTHKDERGGFFSLLMYPPEDLKSLTRKPLEMVFVLDCSGSMNGRPIAQAKIAVERALRNMQPGDSFQIVRFSMGASQLGTAPVAATPENVQRGLKYLESLQGEGGTMMIEGIKAALDFPHDPSRLRFVAFLTDGYIGNEAEILREIHGRLGATRIFSFGVGTATNRFLLDGMAKMGNGAVAYVSLNDNAGEIMDAFFERISHPAMTDLAVNWGGAQVSDVFPSRMPDLFVGRPVVVTGRFSGEMPSSVTIHGEAGERVVDMAVPVDAGDASATHAGLPAVWARTKIADMADRSLYTDGSELPGAIKQVALEYSLMSAYTAFVAVDSLTRTAGDHGTTVNQAVPVPAGVRYETTVQE
jgi:Ca-activated chloride channel homolog